ncbi:MAG: T9SS type A sorting domain-containing protein, partial [Prevotellaceae bacterium]|nr:T9SS type A sorting domain-containing protein [Prevotellaceae bacterium]
YPAISITASRRGIHILSNDGSPLESVRIYDLQGRILLDEQPAGSAYLYPVSKPGVYIVRVENRKVSETKKLSIR